MKRGIKDKFKGEHSVILPRAVVDMEKTDVLTKSLYITDIGYYPHAENHYRERTSPIREHVLIYCVAGEGWYSIGGKTYDVRQGQYFILISGEPHSYGASSDNPWTIYWVHFSGLQSDIYANGAQTPQDVRPSVNSRINERNNIFEEIFYTLNMSTDQESLRYASSLLHYYLATMRYIKLYRTAGGRQIDTTDVVATAIHYMKENILNKLSLDDLADYIGYSKSHFSAMFRAQTGMSPLAYYKNLKIERACDMLSNSSMKIVQICNSLGIDDPYYFSRLFRKEKGMSPQQYRKLLVRVMID